jgi:hypothetical protein
MAKTHKHHPEAGENSHLSLVDKILEIGHHRIPNEKSRIWFENLTCLWTDTNHSKVMQIKRGTAYGCGEQDFIAVSYTSKHTPGLESGRNHGYIVVEAGGQSRRQSIVRDEVLARVLCYARHNGLRRFWIDRECSPLEEDSEEKQITMDSMDLLYRDSRHPIGLLAVILNTQSGVNHVQTLMMGYATVRDNEDEYPRLICSTISRVSLGIFDVLVHLHTDRWWTRAWTFQEEYLSSTSMRILIRREPGLMARHRFGFLQGGICLNAADFRTQATLFSLAFKREANHKFAKKCATMLKMFGRYDIQYRFQHDAKKRAMSPRIFAGMQRRNLDRPFDRLPIVANSCNYAIRFVSQKMSEGNHCLDLCLLTMSLLNGELLRDGRDIRKLPVEMDITNYMQYISFNKFELPGTKRRLSYLKACRLDRVSLQQAGIWTEGILWVIAGTLLPSTWPRCPQRSRKRHQTGLSNFQRDRLLQLADILGISGAEGLASAIRKYLDTDMTCKKLTAAKKHMDIMAGSIVQAMGAGTPLQTAGAKGSRKTCGIFISKHDENMTIFTSWHAGIDVDGRWRQSQVSLGVGVQDSMSTPLLDTVKWVNGLAFFKKCEQTPVIFKWPRMWAEEPIDSLLGTSPRAKLVHPRDHACSNNQSQTGVTA